MRTAFNNFLVKATNYRLVNNVTFEELSRELGNEPLLDTDFYNASKRLKKIYKTDGFGVTDYTAFSMMKNIIHNNIEGCIVECGVFRGQKISFFLEALVSLDVVDRDVYIIDTFQGMTEPGDTDIQVVDNKRMNEGDKNIDLQSVKNNIYQTNYPRNKLHFIKTDVRDKEKLKNSIKGPIALLRLDTDFYDSTLAILEALYTRVAKNGCLIHDDYGHWKGHHQA